MVVYTYLIGDNYEKCSQTQIITIQKCTGNSGKKLFEFFSTNQDTIIYLKINFVPYEKDGQNTPYFYINQIDENKFKQTSQISFALNQSGYEEELSDEYSDYTNNNIKFIMIVTIKQDQFKFKLKLKESLEKYLVDLHKTRQFKSIWLHYQQLSSYFSNESM